MTVFDEHLSQSVVDGILKGYKDYLEVRLHAKKTLHSSGGYAFVRGNHIESSVADEANNYFKNIELDKAGYSWEYLKFSLGEERGACLVLFKNARRLQETFRGSKGDSKYLVEFAKINDDWLNSQEDSPLSTLQLELFTLQEQSDLKEAMQHSTYQRFYVVTYDIDVLTKKIVSIQVTAPNARTGAIHVEQDLSDYIASSTVNISEQEYEVIQGEVDNTSFVDFGYVVDFKEQSKEESE